MIKTEKGVTQVEGDYADMLSDIACIITTINLKTPIQKKLILQATKDGLKVAEMIKNGENVNDFFKE